MRVNKYAVEMDDGSTMRISGARNETHARQLAERDSKTGAAAVSVRLIERGRWG